MSARTRAGALFGAAAFIASVALAMGCGDTSGGAPSGSAANQSATPAKSTPAPSASTAKQTPRSGVDSGSASAAPPSASGASSATADSGDVPTEADFEEAAEKSITLDNLDDELAKIETEIHKK